MIPQTYFVATLAQSRATPSPAGVAEESRWRLPPPLATSVSPSCKKIGAAKDETVEAAIKTSVLVNEICMVVTGSFG